MSRSALKEIETAPTSIRRRAAHPKATGSRASNVRLDDVSQHARAARFECVAKRSTVCPMIDLVRRGVSVGTCRLNTRAATCFCFAPRGHTQQARTPAPPRPRPRDVCAGAHAHANFALDSFFRRGDVSRGGRAAEPPFSSPTVVGQSWATGSDPSHGASRIDCRPDRPCDVRSTASDCSDPQMIRFRREIGRNRRLENRNFATRGRFLWADGSGTVRDLQSPSTVAARVAAVVRAVRFVRTLRCSRPVPRSRYVVAPKHPSRNKLPRRLEQ